MLLFASVSESECRSVASKEDETPSSHVWGSASLSDDFDDYSVDRVSDRHRKDYSIAANTSSSDTVANVVAESDIP
jgi:hypothetical protein